MNTVLKWAGGKTAIMGHLKKVLPTGKRLIEPFAGSCALIQNTDYEQYIVADINPDLINVYEWIKSSPGDVVDLLRQLYADGKTREQYENIRSIFNARNSDSLHRAASFIYLNRHGYRGLCRYNKGKGEFNVPWYGYKNPYFPENEINFLADKLINAELACAGYQQTLLKAQPGDVVYCDPPYANPGKFTNYHSSGFTLAMQEELIEILHSLAENDVHVVASCHDSKIIRKMYKGFKIRSITAPRSIYDGKGAGKKAKEIIASKLAQPAFH